MAGSAGGGWGGGALGMRASGRDISGHPSGGAIAELRDRWVSEARRAGRLGEAAELEAGDVSATEDMSENRDMSLSAARASQAIEQLRERDPSDDQAVPWRRRSE